MKGNLIIELGIIMLFIFLSASFVSIYVEGIETPLTSLFECGNGSKSPSYVISPEQIEVFDDKIVIHVSDAHISRYAPTGSMRPVLDSTANGIQIRPLNSDAISVGDIVSFQKDNVIIVHRVIDKGEDTQGVYFITKGDNTALPDGKIRFSDITYKTIGVIY